ncbi:MAG: DUF2332 family protein [Solirubrobacteraceae bacterium]
MTSDRAAEQRVDRASTCCIAAPASAADKRFLFASWRARIASRCPATPLSSRHTYRRRAGTGAQTRHGQRCSGWSGAEPGFLATAAATRKPLRTLELGASAGLNLNWRHYRFESVAGWFGEPDSPVSLRQ